MFEFLSRVFHAVKSELAPPERASAPTTLYYAIGDIHGRADLLARLLEKFQTETRPYTLVFLGDYIDRGAHSNAVIDALIALGDQDRNRVIFLKGNHEATLLDFLDEPMVGPNWANYGGLETLMSYGVKPPMNRTDPKAWAECQAAFKSALPPSHLNFYKSLLSWHADGCYFFVHAGVDPTRPVQEQSDQEYLWIRDSFMHDDRALDHIIVHGHTPEPQAHHDHRRIGLDTGAYSTGVLSAARLDGDKVEFITT